MVDMDVHHHPCEEAVILGCHPEFFPKGVRACSIVFVIRSPIGLTLPTCLTCACSVISGSEAVAISNEIHTYTVLIRFFYLDHDDSTNQVSHVDV